MNAYVYCELYNTHANHILIIMQTHHFSYSRNVTNLTVLFNLLHNYLRAK